MKDGGDNLTLGRLEVGGPYPSVSVIYCVDAGCGGPEPEPPVYDAICILSQNTTGEQNQTALAYAHLFAAAPALLAACEALPDFDIEWADAYDFKDHAGSFRKAMRLARAAIALAKPEKP